MKAYKKRSSYKSVDHWLDSVYRKNKKYIDSKLEGFKNKKASFKQAVKGYMEEDGLSPEASLKAVEKSTLFTPVYERMRKNLIEGMKSHDVYKDFRNLNRSVSGKFLRLDMDRFNWDEEQGVYYYTTTEGKIIVIEIINSPEQFLVYEVEENEGIWEGIAY